jgi:hypothetical protein
MTSHLTLLLLALTSSPEANVCDLAEGVVCAPPLIACYNGGLPVVCKNLQSDPANCGACGNVCATGYTCYNSQCQVISSTSGGSGGGGTPWDGGVIVENPDDFPGQSWGHPAYVITDAGGGGGGGGASWDAGVLIEQQPIQVNVDGGALNATVTNKVNVVDDYLEDGGNINATITNIVNVIDQYIEDGGNVNVTVTNKVSVVDQYLADGGDVNVKQVGAGTSPSNPLYVNSFSDGGGTNLSSGPGTGESSPLYVSALTDGGPLPVQGFDGGYALNEQQTPLQSCTTTASTTLTTDTEIPATALTGRRTIDIQNLGPLNIWCSTTSAVTTTTGILIAPNSSLIVDASANIAFYCISSTAQASAQTISLECY